MALPIVVATTKKVKNKMKAGGSAWFPSSILIWPFYRVCFVNVCVVCRETVI